MLPPRKDLSQNDVQSLLDAEFRRSGDLDACLRGLERWSNDAGYFDHLAQTNDFLSFQSNEFGVTLRLQINYSRLGYKPAARPRAIACPLCFENIGTPGKELLRVFEFPLGSSPFFAHLTPFPLHAGHFVMNSRAHEPMRIGERALCETASFLRGARGWLAASNSDIEWAGASVLGHHHCQLFRELRLPLEDARVAKEFEDGMALLHWPSPVFRIEGSESFVIARGARLIADWKDVEPGHNTANFLMRREEERVVLHVLLRNSRFRTSGELLDIKREGIGIIEMAGEIIVPPREGLDREENHRWYAQRGAAIIPALIAANAPSGESHHQDFFESRI